MTAVIGESLKLLTKEARRAVTARHALYSHLERVFSIAFPCTTTAGTTEIEPHRTHVRLD